MTTFLATFVLALLVVGVALWGFIKFGSPVYRVERVNVIALLELIEARRATPTDWDVFMAVPIRHCTELADIQLRCAEIAEREYLGQEKRLFTERGLQELTELLAALKAMDKTEQAEGTAARDAR